MKFLIVDDSAQMRRCIKQFLPDKIETVECRDGLEAIAAFTQHRPDWVLMDLRMKEMDGLEATAGILDSFPEARVVIVTDYDDPELRRAAREAGACGYINKRNLLELRKLLSFGPE